MHDIVWEKISFEPRVHRALLEKANETQRTLSGLANEAVRLSLVEDELDLAAFDERASERTISYEELLQDLSARGRI